jgi:DNA-binding Lrp family transcriptional regulator
VEDHLANLDQIDRLILREVQREEISQVELARRIALSPAAVSTRLRRLHELGYIRKVVALVDREKIGFDLLCIVGVTLERHSTEQVQAFHAAIQQLPEVLECYSVTGEFDYLLKVVARNRKELEQFLLEKLTHIPDVARMTTSIVLSEVKNTTELEVKSSE